MALLLPPDAPIVIVPPILILLALFRAFIILGLAFAVYRLVKKEFFEITRLKVIILGLIYGVSLIFSVIHYSKEFNLLGIIAYVITILASLIAGFICLSGITYLFMKLIFRSKKTKEKDRFDWKEATGIMISILLLNGITLSYLSQTTSFMVYNTIAPTMNNTCGALVISFMPDTPSKNSGMRAYETILKVDGVDVSDEEDFESLMNKTHPNQEIVIETDKNNYEIKLEAHPQNPNRGYLGILSMSKKCKI